MLLILLMATTFHAASETKTVPDSLRILYLTANTDSVRLESLRQIINYWKTIDEDSIIYYSKILVQEAEKSGQARKAYKGYYWLASIYGNNNIYDSALYYCFQGERLFQKDSLLYPQTIMLIFIGEQYRAMEQFDKAIYYLKQAMKIASEAGLEKQLIGATNRLAAAFHENRQHEEALLWADSSIRMAKRLNTNDYMLNNLTTIGAVHRDQGHYQLALSNFILALDEARNIQDEINEISILNNIASTYLQMHQYKMAINAAKQSYEKSSKKDFKAFSVVSSELLSKAYAEMDDYKNAYEYLRIYEATRHLIFFEERDAQMSELHTKYDTEVKEKQIELQKVNLEHKDLLLHQKNTTLIFFIIIIALFVVFSVYMFLTHKKLRAAHVDLSIKNKEVESNKVEIQHAYEKLSLLDEQKQAFISMLVHDLKNPLNLLVNIDVFEEEKEKKMLINRSSKQMLNIVMNILDVSASEDRPLKLHPERILISDLLQFAARDVDFLCIPKNINLLYQSEFDFFLTTDKEILHRVFVNLFTNAIKFSPDNDTILIKAIIDIDGLLEISVKDNGEGISPENQNIIFEKFKQVEQIKSASLGSTGLGLAFCKIACEANQWQIGVDSELGKGARFWIKISDFDKVANSAGELDLTRN